MQKILFNKIKNTIQINCFNLIFYEFINCKRIIVDIILTPKIIHTRLVDYTNINNLLS